MTTVTLQLDADDLNEVAIVLDLWLDNVSDIPEDELDDEQHASEAALTRALEAINNVLAQHGDRT